MQKVIKECERKTTYYDAETTENNNQRDDKLKKLTRELQEKTNLLTQYNKRIEEFESELIARDNECTSKLKDIKIKDDIINDKVAEIIDLKQFLKDTQDLYDIDREKIEKYKNSLQQRNNKIMELEDIVEKQKTKILNLEGRLETAQNEVKRKNDELLTKTKSPIRSNTQQKSDVASFLVPSTSNVTKVSPKMVSTKSILSNSSSSSPLTTPTFSPSSSPLTSSPRKNSSSKTTTTFHETNDKELITKLKLSEKKALKIIHEMLTIRKTRDHEIKNLHEKMRQKDDELQRLRDTLKNYDKLLKDNNITKLSSNNKPLNSFANNNKSAENEVLYKDSSKTRIKKH